MGRSIRPRLTGVGRHVANLVHALTGEPTIKPLTVFVTQDAPSLREAGIDEVRAPFPTPNEYARAFWEQTVVPWQVARRRVELYHSPNYILPLALPAPAVVTLHDVTYLDPTLHKWTSHHYLTFLTALALRKARAVIAVSDYTRRRVEALYPHTQGRVQVIYQGVEPTFRPPAPADLEAFRRRTGIDHPYVLYVGTIEPRKNVVRLIEAFEMAIAEGELPHHLYLVGAWGWKTGPVADALRRAMAGGRVHVAGYVPNEDLPLYYAGADVFLYPSIEEGFGLPAAEAMACGTPVVTSNTSSLPEVVGDAALTVDPLDVSAIAEGILQVVTNCELRTRLRAAGLQRAARFSWQQSAREHARVYERVLGASS